MLIDSNGEKHGLVSYEIALEKARNLSLDLVQVSPPSSDPVVCKILDYGKHLFDKKKNTILVKNIEGPLNHLSNNWTFTDKKNNITEVTFDIDFEIKNKFLNSLMIVSFQFGLEKIADAFQKRAEELFGISYTEMQKNYKDVNWPGSKLKLKDNITQIKLEYPQKLSEVQ